MKKLATLLFFVLSISIFYSQNQDVKQSTKKLEDVFMYINHLYVDDVNNKLITDAAITAALEKLDPHSTYIPKEDVDDANQVINGNFVGVGIRFQLLKDTLIVVATIPGGPSEKIGIQAGDKIVKVDGKSIANVKLKNSQVREKLMGELGSKVQVEILRKNEKKPLNFTITRDKIPLNSVDCAYMITPTTGYIKLNSFSHTSTDEIKSSLAELNKQGMKNLILDLQDNGGGVMMAARNICDEFLSKDKLVVYSEGKHQPRQNLVCDSKGQFEKGKLIVLVNENSASASEIVSGAIQDWDRGLIIGRRTYGKGLVQRPISLTDGSEIRLTIARYFTPSGRNIQKPYEANKEEYHKDFLKRLAHGELSSQDSIKFPDSLKFRTKNSNRIVYGGGGIMPDIFVPLDTNEFKPYFRKVLNSGAFNSFSLSYVNTNRSELKTEYPEFSKYKESFQCNQEFMKTFFDFVEKESPEIKFNEQEYKENEVLFKVFLKALIAQNNWGTTEFYQIYNQRNAILNKALDVINNDKSFKHFKIEH
jgi:carboxyl-terminal processing protease